MSGHIRMYIHTDLETTLQPAKWPLFQAPTNSWMYSANVATYIRNISSQVLHSTARMYIQPYTANLIDFAHFLFVQVNRDIQL